MQLMTDEKYLTVDEVARILRLHRETIKELLRAGALPGRKLGRTWRVSQEALDEYMRGQDQGAKK